MTGDGPQAPFDPASGHGLLSGVRICLVFEHSLAHYSRILQELAALQEEGASVLWLTSADGDDGAPPGVGKVVAPLDSSIAGSTVRWRPLRVALNLAKDARASLAERARPGWTARLRAAALEKICPRVDVFWVVDFPAFPPSWRWPHRQGPRSSMRPWTWCRSTHYLGEATRALSLDEESRLIGRVDGFITACDSYADYYVERYGRVLRRPPVVRDNMPASRGAPFARFEAAALLVPRRAPLRPAGGRAAESDVPRPGRRDADLPRQESPRAGARDSHRRTGTADRVTILDPCPTGAIVPTAAAYDVGVVALRGENENERRASTTKLFTSMAGGLAILGSDLPGIARIVRRHGNGLLVDGMRPALRAAAIGLCRNVRRRHRRSEAALA